MYLLFFFHLSCCLVFFLCTLVSCQYYASLCSWGTDPKKFASQKETLKNHCHSSGWHKPTGHLGISTFLCISVRNCPCRRYSNLYIYFTPFTFVVLFKLKCFIKVSNYMDEKLRKCSERLLHIVFWEAECHYSILLPPWEWRAVISASILMVKSFRAWQRLFCLQIAISKV